MCLLRSTISCVTQHNLQMCNTMTDRFLVWQPAINFYNARQSVFAYMKQFANTHLGAMANVGTTLVMGGVRSFGKVCLPLMYLLRGGFDESIRARGQYFCRLRLYYHEEVERVSVRTLGNHFGGWWGLMRPVMLALGALALLIPVLPWFVSVVGFLTAALAVLVLSLLTWRFHTGRLVPPRGNRYQQMFPLDRGFIQSEDSRHGGPFGRAAFVSEGFIHESTPPSFLDEMERENSKCVSIASVLHAAIPRSSAVGCAGGCPYLTCATL